MVKRILILATPHENSEFRRNPPEWLEKHLSQEDIIEYCGFSGEEMLEKMDSKPDKVYFTGSLRQINIGDYMRSTIHEPDAIEDTIREHGVVNAHRVKGLY